MTVENDEPWELNSVRHYWSQNTVAFSVSYVSSVAGRIMQADVNDSKAIDEA